MVYKRKQNEEEKYGFVYIWYDTKQKRYYVGCHWGTTDDGYVCSSNWMRDTFRRRPGDFKRRIINTDIPTREETYITEQRYLNMIKPAELKVRYYNLNITNNEVWHKYPEHIKTVGQRISAAKKGKKTGPCTPEKAKAISDAKKKMIAERGGFTDEHREKLRQAKLGKKLSPEHRSKVIRTLKNYKG